MWLRKHAIVTGMIEKGAAIVVRSVRSAADPFFHICPFYHSPAGQKPLPRSIFVRFSLTGVRPLPCPAKNKFDRPSTP